MTLRTRLTLWHLAVMAAILSVCALAVYGYVRESLFTLIDSRLDKSLAILVDIVRTNPQRLAEVERQLHVLPFSVRERERVWHESTDWVSGQLAAADNAPHTGRWVFVTPAGAVYHLQETRVALGTRLLQIRTAKSGEQIYYDLARLRLALIGGFPAALLLSWFGAYFLTGRALSPMQQLARRAQAIGADNLAERLTAPNTHDEIGQLTAVLNATFARLEDSFTRLKRFTQDAAHELRTPLAVLRSTGEVGLQKPRDNEGYRDTIANMLEEVERLTQLVDDLLMLACADAGTIDLQRRPENVAALCRELSDCLRPLAEDKQQRLDCDTPDDLCAVIDRKSLRLALINVLANAIRFTPARGDIRVSCALTAGRVVVEICDNGPGIAPAQHARVFERFYRVDPSHSHERGGSGLGLAIARWAVETNGGVIEIDSDLGRGSRFRILLPPG